MDDDLGVFAEGQSTCGGVTRRVALVQGRIPAVRSLERGEMHSSGSVSGLCVALHKKQVGIGFCSLVVPSTRASTLARLSDVICGG